MKKEQLSHYQVLGVESNATDEQIKAAFRQLAMQKHPDKGGLEEEFREISSAFEVLSNPESRQRYDATLIPVQTPKFDIPEVLLLPSESISWTKKTRTFNIPVVGVRDWEIELEYFTCKGLPAYNFEGFIRQQTGTGYCQGLLDKHQVIFELKEGNSKSDQSHQLATEQDIEKKIKYRDLLTATIKARFECDYQRFLVAHIHAKVLLTFTKALEEQFATQCEQWQQSEVCHYDSALSAYTQAMEQHYKSILSAIQGKNREYPEVGIKFVSSQKHQANHRILVPELKLTAAYEEAERIHGEYLEKYVPYERLDRAWADPIVNRWTRYRDDKTTFTDCEMSGLSIHTIPSKFYQLATEALQKILTEKLDAAGKQADMEYQGNLAEQMNAIQVQANMLNLGIDVEDSVALTHDKLKAIVKQQLCQQLQAGLNKLIADFHNDNSVSILQRLANLRSYCYSDVLSVMRLAQDSLEATLLEELYQEIVLPKRNEWLQELVVTVFNELREAHKNKPEQNYPALFQEMFNSRARLAEALGFQRDSEAYQLLDETYKEQHHKNVKEVVAAWQQQFDDEYQNLVDGFQRNLQDCTPASLNQLIEAYVEQCEQLFSQDRFKKCAAYHKDHVPQPRWSFPITSVELNDVNCADKIIELIKTKYAALYQLQAENLEVKLESLLSDLLNPNIIRAEQELVTLHLKMKSLHKNAEFFPSEIININPVKLFKGAVTQSDPISVVSVDPRQVSKAINKFDNLIFMRILGEEQFAATTLEARSLKRVQDFSIVWYVKLCVSDTDQAKLKQYLEKVDAARKKLQQTLADMGFNADNAFAIELLDKFGQTIKQEIVNCFNSGGEHNIAALVQALQNDDLFNQYVKPAIVESTWHSLPKHQLYVLRHYPGYEDLNLATTIEQPINISEQYLKDLQPRDLASFFELYTTYLMEHHQSPLYLFVQDCKQKIYQEDQYFYIPTKTKDFKWCMDRNRKPEVSAMGSLLLRIDEAREYVERVGRQQSYPQSFDKFLVDVTAALQQYKALCDAVKDAKKRFTEQNLSQDFDSHRGKFEQEFDKAAKSLKFKQHSFYFYNFDLSNEQEQLKQEIISSAKSKLANTATHFNRLFNRGSAEVQQAAQAEEEKSCQSQLST